MRKTIATQTIFGPGKAQATVRKWLAVNRTDDDYWAVTYRPMGVTIPGYFVSKRDAITASKLARPMFPYPYNKNHLPTEGEWFDTLKFHAIPFIR